MNLEQMYPILRDKIREAKKANISDEAIHRFIQEQYLQPALKAGVTPKALLEYVQQRPLTTRALEALGRIMPETKVEPKKEPVITKPKVEQPKPKPKPLPKPLKFEIPFEPTTPEDIAIAKFKPPTKEEEEERRLGILGKPLKQEITAPESWEEYIQPINRAKEALKGFTLTFLGIPQAVGSLLQEAGEVVKQNMEFWEKASAETAHNTILKRKTLRGLRDLVDKYFIDTGKSLVANNLKMLEERGIKPHPTDKISQWLFKGGAAVSSLGTALGLTLLTRSPRAASVAFGVMQKSRVYQEARAAGKTPEEASLISTKAGVIEGALEKIGLDFFLGRYGNTLLNTAVRAGSEAIQEAGQELGYNLTAKLGYEPSRKLSEGVMESAIIGAAVGAPVAMVVLEMAKGEPGNILKNAGINPESKEGEQILTTLLIRQRKEVSKVMEDLKVNPPSDEEVTGVLGEELPESIETIEAEGLEPDLRPMDSNAEETATKERKRLNRPLLPEEKRAIEAPYLDRGVDTSFQVLTDLGYSPEQIASMTMDTKVEIANKELREDAVSIMPDGSFTIINRYQAEPEPQDTHPKKPEHIEIPYDFTYYSNIIRAEGGIAPYLDKYLNEDLYARVPLYMRSKRGMRIDEWATRFGMTEDELLNIIYNEQEGRRRFIREMQADAVNKEAIYDKDTSEEEFIHDSPDIGLTIKQVVPKEIEGRPVELIRRPKDLNRYSFERFFAPVRAIAKKNPLAGKIAHLGRDTYLFMHREQENTSAFIDKFFKGINEKRRIHIGKLLDKEPTEGELNALSSKERKAYENARNLLKKAKQEAKNIGVDVSKWSIPDDSYFPHIFIGQYQIMVGDKTIGFANDLDECFSKAKMYLVENENDIGKVHIKPRSYGREFPPVLLTRKGFFSFIKKIEEATTISPDQLKAILERGQWVTEEEVIGVTERKITEEGEPITPEAPAKVEAKIKEALTVRGWTTAEADQMISRLKASKSTDEATAQINIIVERTIEKVKKTKKVYTVGSLQEIRKDVYGALQGIVAIRPRRKYVGNFMHRVANLDGFIEDPLIALKIYMNRVIRKKYIDPFRRQAEDLADQLPRGLREYFREYIDGISGTYSGEEGFLVRYITPKTTKAEAFLKLGYRPSSALINRLQPYSTAYAEIGNYIFLGQKFMHTAEGRDVIERSGVVHMPSKFYALEEGIPDKMRFWDALYMFHKSEQNARKQVVAGSYLFAKKVFGMDRAKAIKRGYGYILNYLAENNNNVDKAALAYARDVIADTMYIYDNSDLPLLLRSPIGRMVFQFRAYTINNLYQSGAWIREALKNPNPHNVARVVRLIGSNVLLGGIKLPIEVTKLVLPTSLRRAILLGLIASIVTEDDEVMKETKLAIYNGVFSLIGVDLTQRIAPDIYIPTKPVDLFGVTASDLHLLYKNHKAGVPIEETIPKIFLASGLPLKIRKYFWQGHTIKGYRDRPEMADATGWERFLDAIGFTPTRLGLYRTVDQLTKEDNMLMSERRRVYIDRILEAESEEDTDKAISIKEQARAEGIIISSEALSTERKKKRMSRIDRMFKQMRKETKQKYEDILRELREEGG